jgi:hypothetical protein
MMKERMGEKEERRKQKQGERKWERGREGEEAAEDHMTWQQRREDCEEDCGDDVRPTTDISLMPKSSTSKCNSAFGGMTSPTPSSP